jgi:hypothetical protein
MYGFISWLEATPVSAAMRDMPWLWPACESLHFMGLCLLIGGAGFLDLRLMGFMPRLSIATARAYMPWAIAGFAINLCTGVLFFVMAPAMYAFSAAWWAKVFFIVLAGLNAMFFETTQGARVLAMGPEETTPLTFRIIGAVSLLSWFAVLYFGRMLPYIGTGN